MSVHLKMTVELGGIANAEQLVQQARAA